MIKTKGFVVPLLLAIIALLIVGFAIYIYTDKKPDSQDIQLVTEPIPTYVASGGAEEDEDASGIIKAFRTDSTGQFTEMDIDYVEFIPGGPDGVHMQNNNPLIRTFDIDPSATFLFQDGTSMTLQAFRRYFMDAGPSTYQKYNPWDIQVRDGFITSIKEHFVP